MLKIHDLKPARNSKKDKKRVGRGIAGKGGKTAGRGTKGQKARDTVSPGFEGGQLPLTQRIPKLRGFKNPFKVYYDVVNLDDLQLMDESSITLEVFKSKKIGETRPVKILGDGTLEKKIEVWAHSASKSARAAIESKGGQVHLVDLPFKSGRPPKRGSALANR